MTINKEYLESIQVLIEETPWRCNDKDLQSLLNFTETLVLEHEQLKRDHSALLTNHIQHTDMLRNQFITSMINKKD